MPLLPGEVEEDFFPAEEGDDNLPAKDTKKAAEPVEDEGEGSGSGEEEEYVVEKILKHGFLDDGTLQLEVKWEGYSRKDATWEPAESIEESAFEAAEEYYNKLGGRPEPGEQKGKKKRKADESSATQNGSLRVRKKTKSEDSDDIPPREKTNRDFRPPKGTWEHEMNSIDAIEEVDNEKGDTVRMAYVIWNNGVRSKHELLQLHDKCPRKMLQYYYDHLHFKYTGPSENYPKAQNDNA